MDFDKKISIDSLDLLVSFYDDLDEFNDGLERILKKHRNRDVGKLLDAIAMGKKVFMMPNDVKEFYEKHQDFFQAIIEKRQASKYYVKGAPLVYPFLFSWYNVPIANFYHYLKEHEADVPKMLPVVDKLKKIGVSEVTLDEDADFTSDVYYTSGTFDITLLDNMETLPTYKKDVACYHSLDSKYKITRPRNERYWPYNDSREITLTSLVIDPETLPDSLEDAAIGELFSGMINETSEMNQAISRSVELHSMIIDYDGAVRSLSGGLKNFESMDISPAMQKALSFGQQALTSLQKQSEKLDKWIIKTYPTVSEDELGDLQKTYRREVEFRRMDLD